MFDRILGKSKKQKAQTIVQPPITKKENIQPLTNAQAQPVKNTAAIINQSMIYDPEKDFAELKDLLNSLPDDFIGLRAEQICAKPDSLTHKEKFNITLTNKSGEQVTVSMDPREIQERIILQVQKEIDQRENWETLTTKIRTFIQNQLQLCADDNLTKQIKEVFFQYDSHITPRLAKLCNAYKPVHLTSDAILDLKTTGYLLEIGKFMHGKSEADLGNSENYNIFSSMVQTMLHEKLAKEQKLLEVYRKQYQEFTSQFNLAEVISNVESLSQSIQKIPVPQDTARKNVLSLLDMWAKKYLPATRSMKECIDRMTPDEFERFFNVCKDHMIPIVLQLSKIKQSKGREHFGLNAPVSQEKSVPVSGQLQENADVPTLVSSSGT